MIDLSRAIMKVEQAIDSAITPANIYIDPVLEAAKLVVNLKNQQCNVLSPETQSPCVLPPTRQAHIAGHESEYVSYGRAVWATTMWDWWTVLTDE